jgi:uncharacterized phage-associated protein
MSSSAPPYDPRAVANLLLDLIEEGRRRRATHIDLEKLLYFAHGRFLLATGIPLVSGYFEAWEYGPVHPGVYDAFKSARDKPIDFRAVSTNFVTGEQKVLEPPDSAIVREHVGIIVRDYGQLTTGQLVDLSHATNGPWDQVVQKATRQVTLGARMSNDLIKMWFQRHKIAIGSVSRSRSPRKDEPFTGYRSGQRRSIADR